MIRIQQMSDPAYECLPDGPSYLDPCNYKDESDDPQQAYEGVLDGIIGPHRLVGYKADYAQWLTMVLLMRALRIMLLLAFVQVLIL